MKIDNGRRVRLDIAGLFAGEAGEADGIVALIPNGRGRAPRRVRGTIDGAAVQLELASGVVAPPFVAYRWRALA